MFTEPGVCTIPECEAALLFDDGSKLYACKHKLADISDFFKGLFYGQFDEQKKNEIKLQKLKRDDVLLFLECAATEDKSDLKTIPNDSESICTLVILADQFMCEQLKTRLLTHLTNEERNIWSAGQNIGSILQTAFEHADGCPTILKYCIERVPLAPYTLGDILEMISQFKCATLTRRLNEYLNADNWHRGLYPSQKVPLLVSAYKYRKEYPPLLPLCIKLCATLPVPDLAQLHTKVSADVVAAVCLLRVRMTHKFFGDKTFEYSYARQFEVDMQLID